MKYRDIEKVLISADQINKRTDEIANKLLKT